MSLLEMSFFVFVFCFFPGSGNKDEMINVFHFPSRMCVCVCVLEKSLMIGPGMGETENGALSNSHDNDRRGANP